MAESQSEQFAGLLTPPVVALPPLGYEQRLANDARWALSEGSRFFEERSAVQTSLRKITRRLNELGIRYGVAGGMALFRHGLRRFTEDVDVLISRDSLRAIHKQLDGRGYLPLFAGSKNLRDTETGVRIEFLIAGDFPGDGRPKPVAFPDPAEVVVELEGIQYIDVPTLVELKLASGMTAAGRMKDLADVQQLITAINLPADFSARLNPFVRDKFRELWITSQPVVKRYLRIWQDESLPAEIASMDELLAHATADVVTLRAMRDDGVTLDRSRGVKDGCVYLVSTDPAVAEKYEMHDEADFRD